MKSIQIPASDGSMVPIHSEDVDVIGAACLLVITKGTQNHYKS